MIRVPAIGPKNADIMLVGEAPSWDEVKHGAPFVGPAGGQLDRLLAAAGIRRESVYITNVIKYMIPQKPKEKEAFFFRSGSPTQEYMDGIIELATEIKSVKPNVVVPLGNYALWALTGNLQIMRWRGSILSSTLVPDLKVIPTIHPAFYIHGYDAMLFKEPLGIWDLTRVREESEFPDIILPEANLIVQPSRFDVDEAVDRLLSGSVIVADTEWYAPEDIAYISYTNDPSWAICIPMEYIDAHRKLLGSDVPKVWQNAMFDVVALNRIGIEVKNVRDDTMIAWHSCWQDIREKSLAVIGSVLTRWPYYKDELHFVGRDDVRGQTYCCRDSVVTAEAMEKIETREFDYTGGRQGYDISMSIFDIFCRASSEGIRIDADLLNRKKKFYLERAAQTEEKLAEAIGRKINCRSGAQVARLVYDDLGVKRASRSTEQKELMDITAGMSDPTIRAVLTAVIRVRQDLNVVSRYLHDGVIDKDNRVRTNWNLAGTRSGRLSSTIPWWNGVALQTAPDDLRECLIPDDGFIFLGWDQAQAEARVVAVKTKDYDLLEDMEKGIDIHLQLASRLPFGLTYEELVAMCDELGKDHVPQRYIAKRCRHALNYVMGPDVFRLAVNKEYLDTNIGLDVSGARRIHAAYHELHPGLKWWWEQVKSQLKKTGTLTNSFGRVRRFTGSIHNSLTEAVSYEPQSTVSDLTTTTIAAADRLLSDLPAAQHTFFAHMHDGGLLQVREETLEESVEIIRSCMLRTIYIDRHALTIPIDVKVGRNWKEMTYV